MARLRMIITDRYTLGKCITSGIWRLTGNIEPVRAGLSAGTVKAQARLKNSDEYVDVLVTVRDAYEAPGRDLAKSFNKFKRTL